MPRLTGGEILAEYLIKEKVPYVLGIPGHGDMGLFDAFKERADRIRVIQVRHEQSAAHIADGYYRVARQPLVVITSIGPGAVNTLMGVATAYVDSMAMVVITGGAQTYMKGRGVLQEIERQREDDFPALMRPITKESWSVDHVSHLPEVLHRAFKVATTGRPGPGPHPDPDGRPVRPGGRGDPRAGRAPAARPGDAGSRGDRGRGRRDARVDAGR